MTRTTLFLLSAAVAALGGCSREPAPPPTASDESSSGPTATVAATASATPAPSTSPSPDKSPVQTLPIAIQGRWGMVPADCTSTRGDAKGLLIVDPTTLKFYESRGTLGKIAERTETRIRASFAFSGEGMTWTRDEVLDVQPGGKTLIRREFGEDAQPGPLTYARCAA